jgi:hypothetical protein
MGPLASTLSAIALVLSVGALAFAANEETTTSVLKKKTKGMRAAASTVDPRTGSTQTFDNARATTENETVTTVKEAGVAPKKISVGFLSENWVTSSEANTHDYTSFMSQNNVSVGYKLGEGRTIQGRQYFLYNMTDKLGANTWGAGDFALQYSDSNIKIGSAPIDAKARLYLPVSKASQDVGKYELRLYGSATQAAGKYVNVEYAVNPRFYAYSINSNGQVAFRVAPSITASYAKETALFVPYTSFSTDHQWGNTGKGISQSPYSVGGYGYRPVNLDAAYLDIGTRVNLSARVNLEAFFEEAYNLRQAAIFTDPVHDYSGYYLNLSASM